MREGLKKRIQSLEVTRIATNFDICLECAEFVEFAGCVKCAECVECVERVECATHSTNKGPYPFQTGLMQKNYRILTSMDPMHVLLTVI